MTQAERQHRALVIAAGIFKRFEDGKTLDTWQMRLYLQAEPDSDIDRQRYSQHEWDIRKVKDYSVWAYREFKRKLLRAELERPVFANITFAEKWRQAEIQERSVQGPRGLYSMGNQEWVIIYKRARQVDDGKYDGVLDRIDRDMGNEQSGFRSFADQCPKITRDIAQKIDAWNVNRLLAAEPNQNTRGYKELWNRFGAESETTLMNPTGRGYGDVKTLPEYHSHVRNSKRQMAEMEKEKWPDVREGKAQRSKGGQSPTWQQGARESGSSSSSHWQQGARASGSSSSNQWQQRGQGGSGHWQHKTVTWSTGTQYNDESWNNIQSGWWTTKEWQSYSPRETITEDVEDPEEEAWRRGGNRPTLPTTAPLGESSARTQHDQDMHDEFEKGSNERIIVRNCLPQGREDVPHTLLDPGLPGVLSSHMTKKKEFKGPEWCRTDTHT